MDRKVGNIYFTELRHDLQRESFTVGPEENSLLSEMGPPEDSGLGFC